MTDTAPPGWYADPSNSGFEHWWDGTAYTQSRATAPAAPAAPPAAAFSQPQQFGQQQQFGQPAQPGPYAAAAPGAMAYAGPISPKSRTVAVILGFFLGVLGVDRFYLGNIGMGVAKLLVGWLTAGIWPLIDWIIILAGAAHDGDGLPVRNWS